MQKVIFPADLCLFQHGSSQLRRSDQLKASKLLVTPQTSGGYKGDMVAIAPIPLADWIKNINKINKNETKSTYFSFTLLFQNKLDEIRGLFKNRHTLVSERCKFCFMFMIKPVLCMNKS